MFESSLLDQAAIVRSAQAAARRAFQEPHLAIDLRLDPAGPLGTWHRRLAAHERRQPRRQSPLGLLREAAGQFGDVLQLPPPDGADQQTTKSLPRRRVTQHDARNRLKRLDLAPGLSSLAGQIAAFQMLGHRSLMALLDDLAKKRLAAPRDPRRKNEAGIVVRRQQFLQSPPPLGQRPAQQGPAAGIQQIEDDIGRRQKPTGLLDLSRTDELMPAHQLVQ